MPPDEYAEDINNSIYTNLLATYAVHTARWTTCLAEGVDQAVETITHDMIEQMKDIVFNYNEEKGYHEEYDGFADKVDTGKSVSVWVYCLRACHTNKDFSD